MNQYEIAIANLLDLNEAGVVRNYIEKDILSHVVLKNERRLTRAEEYLRGQIELIVWMTVESSNRNSEEVREELYDRIMLRLGPKKRESKLFRVSATIQKSYTFELPAESADDALDTIMEMEDESRLMSLVVGVDGEQIDVHHAWEDPGPSN